MSDFNALVSLMTVLYFAETGKWAPLFRQGTNLRALLNMHHTLQGTVNHPALFCITRLHWCLQAGDS